MAHQASHQLTLFQCTSSTTSPKQPQLPEPTPLVIADYVQEAEEHNRSEDQCQRDDRHDGTEHSCGSEEAEDGSMLDETVSPTEASSTAVTMASSSLCKSRRSSCVHSSIRVDGIASTSASPPVHFIINYPATIYSEKARSFSQALYNGYLWLEYSVIVFCTGKCLFLLQLVSVWFWAWL